MLTFRFAHAVTAEEFESQGNTFDPDIHIIESPDDTAAWEWTQRVLDKYANDVIAYHIARVVPGPTISIELQFGSTPDGEEAAEECRKEYERGFRKGGFVAKKKRQANAKPKSAKTPRLFVNRMYRLPNGQFFWYFGRWDRYGNVVGKVEAPEPPVDDGISLENKIVHRSELEKGELIPKGQEPWTL